MQPHDLDDLFAQARAEVPPLPPALLARVLADARHLQPAARLLKPRLLKPGRQPGFWAFLAGALGGGAGLAGLGGATLAGLFLGFVQPAALTPPLWQDSPLDSVELFPGFDAILTEG